MVLRSLLRCSSPYCLHPASKPKNNAAPSAKIATTETVATGKTIVAQLKSTAEGSVKFIYQYN